MKKILAVVLMLSLVTPCFAKSTDLFPYPKDQKISSITEKSEDGTKGLFAFYGLCVALLSAMALFNPSRTSDNIKAFVAGNAMVAGGYVFYRFYFNKVIKKEKKQ
jgi:hypothetical protein